jgi:hypothetical protein
MAPLLPAVDSCGAETIAWPGERRGYSSTPRRRAHTTLVRRPRSVPPAHGPGEPWCKLFANAQVRRSFAAPAIVGSARDRGTAWSGFGETRGAARVARSSIASIRGSVGTAMAIDCNRTCTDRATVRARYCPRDPASERMADHDRKRSARPPLWCGAFRDLGSSSTRLTRVTERRSRSRSPRSLPGADEHLVAYSQRDVDCRRWKAPHQVSSAMPHGPWHVPCVKRVAVWRWARCLGRGTQGGSR